MKTLAGSLFFTTVAFLLLFIGAMNDRNKQAKFYQKQIFIRDSVNTINKATIEKLKEKASQQIIVIVEDKRK